MSEQPIVSVSNLHKSFKRGSEQYDVMLRPVQPRGAFPHDHSMPQWDREVSIDGVMRPYLDLFSWPGPAGAGSRWGPASRGY